jgi:NifU-like protein
MRAMFHYSEKVRDHFQNPRHKGLILDRDIDPASERLITGEGGKITQGDAIVLTIRLRLADERILDARFQSYGGGMPIVSASCLCALIVGKTFAEALAVTAADLDRELEGLPELKHHRPVLALAALHAAARKYRGEPGPAECGPLLCNCFQVPETEVEKAIRLHRLENVAAVTATTQAGGGCQSCHTLIEEMLGRCRQFEYTVHITPEEYAEAQRQGAPALSEEELKHNPPRR